MLWFNILFTILIVLFTIAVIGEIHLERKKMYGYVLIVCILCFFLMNFFEWSY